MQANTFIEQLANLLGAKQVLTKPQQTAYYRQGFRIGQGEALAVVFPQTLVQLWRVAQLCVEHDKIILMQAAKTGVTGGSTPDGNAYDRELIIVSTKYLKGVHLLSEQQQVIAFPGSSLTELETILKPLGREPHSVIGSSCIGASVVGGVCNNSGGSLIRRGPAYTEMALFARISASGQLELVNNLGLDLGEEPQQMLENLMQSNYTVLSDEAEPKRAWADDYPQKIRDITADTPARYNADPSYWYDASGCAGRLIVFAVRLDTFAATKEPQVFYIGSDQQEILIKLRQKLLTQLTELPIAAEYIHRTCFDISKRYGKPIFLSIKWLGAQNMPKLFSCKGWLDSWMQRLSFLPNNLTDKLLDWLSVCSPNHLPKRMLQYRQQYEHHLIVSIEAPQQPQLQQLLEEFFRAETGAYFRCTKAEGEAAFLHRFAMGGSVASYCLAKHNNINRLVSFDIALRRNDTEFLLQLPEHLMQQVELSVCCGHFLCFVNHQDYVLKAGFDRNIFKQEVLEYLDSRGARYPAEHNVGHWYQAKAEHAQHFRQLDPTNSLNPGIGKTSKLKNWQ